MPDQKPRKPRRGGKRAGAGRKPLDPGDARTNTVSLKVSGDELVHLGRPPAKRLRELLDEDMGR